MATVTLDNVNKVYENGFHAIHDLDLDIEDKEFLVLVGPSGCGKSTALRMIAGLETISGGQMLIGDKVVNDVEPKDRDIAMVFQNYALYPHMTVYDNIGFALKLAKVPKDEIDTRVRQASKILELDSNLHRKPGQLSGGQRQRVAMGRAIVRQPAAFLMDEPLSNLDAKLRVQMRAEIAALQRDLAVTTVYVTHDQMEAMTLASRVAVMREGRIVQLDTPKKIYSEPADLFVAGFIGSPPMNLIEGEVLGGMFEAPGVKIPVAIGNRKEVVLGIRPEDIEITQDSDAAIVGPLYALELTGDATLVTLRQGTTSICVRGPADFEESINDICRLAPRDGARLHLFDKNTGERLAI